MAVVYSRFNKTFAWHKKFKFSLYDFSQSDASLRDCPGNPKEFVQTVMKHIGMLTLHSQHHNNRVV